MNKNKKIWISSPHMGGSEEKYVKEAFDTNWVAPVGPNINGFENDLEKYLGQQSYVSAVNTGTAAIHLGLILLGVKAGDVVLCQSMTFSASANPIVYQGATPVFIDSELDTWNLCPIALEAAITDFIVQGKKPKAIIAVHLYGAPYKIEEVRAISNKYKIPILEDSAEALGSSYKGQKCGTFGEIGVLSFNGNKIITTSGGGAIVTHVKETKDKAIYYATQSREDTPHFEHKEIGYNYRMTNMQAALGVAQLEQINLIVKKKRWIGQKYNELLNDIEAINLPVSRTKYCENIYWVYAITLKDSFKKTAKQVMLLSSRLLNFKFESAPALVLTFLIIIVYFLYKFVNNCFFINTTGTMKYNMRYTIIYYKLI